MNGCQVIRTALHETKTLIELYVSDLSDADFFVRPAPTANHIAWQFGNVIGGDQFIVTAALPDAKFPSLPEGFADLHGSKGASNNGPDGFLTKAGYIELFNKVRAASIAALDGVTDADLDRPTTPPIASFAPTLGKAMLMVANHTLMHAGQFSVVRRLLGKPVLF